VSDLVRTIDQTHSFSQRRRRLKTRFVFADKHLDYSIETKNESALHKRVAWDTVAARSAYFTTIEADGDVSWELFLMTSLTAVAILRGGPEPLTFLGYAAMMILGLVVLRLTQRMREVGFTGIPAPGVNIVVLNDRNHDAIIEEIETRRVTALSALAEPDAAISLRAYFWRLRWLVENGVLTAQEAASRQKLVLPDGVEIPLTSSQAETAPESFRQRRAGAVVSVELLADRFTYRSTKSLGATQSSSVFYRDLGERSTYYSTDHQPELTGVIIAWGAMAIIAWAFSALQDYPGGHYLWGSYFDDIDIRRAIFVFGPALLGIFALATAACLCTRLRYGEPFPGIRLLRDRQYDALLAAIEERRTATLRALANPDPLLPLDEQMRVLSQLRDNAIVSDEDYDRAAKHAAFICGNPLLDGPADPQPQEERLQPVH